MDYAKPVSTINSLKSILHCINYYLLDKHNASEAYHMHHSSSKIFTYRAVAHHDDAPAENKDDPC